MAAAKNLTGGETGDGRVRALLGAVHAGGASALAQILIQAQSGDRVSAEARVADLVAALPDAGWLEARDVLLIVGVCLVETFCQFPVRPTV